MKGFLRAAVSLCLVAAAHAAEPPGPAPPKAPPPAVKLTAEAIKERLKNLEAAKELPENVRTEARKLYQTALEQLAARDQHDEKAKALDALTAGAPAQLKEKEARQKELAATPKPLAADLTADQALALLKEAEAARTVASNELAKAQADAAHRQERRGKLPVEIREAEERASKIAEELKALPQPKDPPEVASARATGLQAQLAAAQAEIQHLKAELASYEAREKLLKARTDVHAAEKAHADKRIEELQKLVDRLKVEEAERAAQKAEAALEAAAAEHPAVRALLGENLELANRRAGPGGLAAQLEATNQRIEAVKKRIARLEEERQSILKRIEAAGMTDAIGLLLRKQHAELPDLRQLRRSVRARQTAIAQLQLQLIDLREKHDPTRPVADEAKAILDQIESPSPRVQRRIRKLVGERREVAQAVITDAEACFNKLFELDLLERELIRKTSQFVDFIDEHVLWIRSAPPLSVADLAAAGEACAWLCGTALWTGARQALHADAASVPVLYLVGAAALLALLVVQRSARRRLGELADRVADHHTDSFGLTAQAIASTIVLALTAPLVLAFLAWRLGAAGANGGDAARTLSQALRRVVGLCLALELFRQLCRPRGIGPAHFRWRAPVLQGARRTIVWWLVAALPLLFVVLVFEHHDDEACRGSLGRLALLAALALTAGLTYRLLRGAGPVFGSASKPAEAGALTRTRRLWFPVLVAVPLALAAGAAFGYAYPAVVLFSRLVSTFLLILGLITLQALVLRWVFVLRRRLAKEQRQRREEEAKGKETPEAARTPDPGGPSRILRVEPQEGEPTISLGELRDQTRTLMRWLVGLSGVVGLYFIWVDVLPALRILHQVVLWGEAGTAGEVTLAHLLLAVGVVVLTVTAGRNLPGLLEVTLLRRLPMDAGARYAIKSVSSYVITLIGLLVVASLIGLRWSSVQWLVAALTVGLGFGLQEIFANFVSGMILLFERPIRVGDTVTVGDVSGTVTRIRIRATTITDWDRKELIVPNKEFITGRLINWTLSDDVLRVRIPVGIAYGSDTAKAHEVMLREARATVNVLPEPPPEALFLGFGDSSLNFEVRVFVRGIPNRLPVTDELHMRIDQAFREAGIEISFPQRDLHLRSAGAPLRVTLERPEPPAAHGLSSAQDQEEPPAGRQPDPK